MVIHGGCWSDIGCRELNEDGVMYRLLNQNGQFLVMCAVFDGIGGLAQGEVASSLLLERADNWFDEVSEWIDIATSETDVIFAHLKDAAESWNSDIYRMRDMEGIQTGSTMSLLVLLRDRYFGVQVGDSRIYCFRSGNLLQLTLDDSVKREVNGKIKSYLTNFMGKSNELIFQSVEGVCRPGDVFMACSDGFYHHLEAKDMSYMIECCREGASCEVTCCYLIQLMLERGERDNTSVTMAYLPEMDATESAKSKINEETVLE